MQYLTFTFNKAMGNTRVYFWNSLSRGKGWMRHSISSIFLKKKEELQIGGGLI